MKYTNNSDLFYALEDKQITNILEQLNIKISSFEKGDILALQEEPCNRLIILTKGTVKTEITDPSGKTIKIEDVYAPSPLALLFLFGENRYFPVQVTATSGVSAIIIPQKSVLKMLQMNEQILINYLNISSHFASTLTKKLHFMSFKTIRQKIASYILDKDSESSDKIVMDKTQHSLADYFGVSRPSLARELSNMQKDNLIKINKREITILDRSQLIHIVKFM